MLLIVIHIKLSKIHCKVHLSNEYLKYKKMLKGLSKSISLSHFVFFQDDLEDLIVNWDESKSIGDIFLKYVSILFPF